VSDSQRAGLIFVDEGTEFSADGDEQADDQVPDSDAADDLTTGERRKRGLARARRGVLLINGVGFFLAATDGLQFEDGDEQALAAAFRAAMEALRKEINRKDQQVADLNQIIAALEDKNLALDADLEALRHKAEQAAGLGRRCYETFCLTLAANAAAGVVYGVTEGGKYLIGQFGGEIFELFTGSAGGDAPSAPLPERTTPT
jgi:exonuclease VII small subunit